MAPRRCLALFFCTLVAVWMALRNMYNETGHHQIQAAHKTFKTKMKLHRRLKKNREVPGWLRVKYMKQGKGTSFNYKRRHWRMSKMKI
eukprot:jgi/Bigna1/58927/fgenesh1_kg.1_\